MQRRELQTPLILWIAALCIAVNIHMMVASGGDFVAKLHEDHASLAGLGAEARDRVRVQNQVFEVAALGDEPPSEEPKPDEVVPPPPEAKKVEEKKPDEPEPPKPDVKKREEEKKVVVVPNKPEEEKKVVPPPEIKSDQRLAVKQHVQPKQDDNPNARFIGNEANHVKEETVARQTSHDQDDPNPTPSGAHAGPTKDPGDSDQQKVAESEEHAGQKNRAPGEKGTEFSVEHALQEQQARSESKAPATNAQPRAAGDDRAPRPTAATSPAIAPGGATGQNNEAVEAAGGSWSFNPVRPGPATGGGQSAAPAGPGSTPNPAGNPATPSLLGLGGHAGAGHINLNLSHEGVVAAVGAEQLHKMQEADGERRRSEHRGSWQASNFERWRSAIENYVTTVKAGNQTALNTAAVPFATYLNSMHNRIHPIFADSFLASLDSLPREHPMQNPKLITKIEIVLSRDGHLVKMGLVNRTGSGVTAFDVAALDSVQRASPFGTAPSAIVSPDGRVYLHWEFHRDEVYACSTIFARPYLLNVPAAAPPANPTPIEHETHEPGGRGTREGSLAPATPSGPPEPLLLGIDPFERARPG